MEEKSRKKWRMILYEDQDYPPNYVDDSFLYDLRFKGFKKLKLKDLLRNMLVVTDHISTIIMLSKLYLLIKNNKIKLSVIYVFILVSLLGVLILMLLNKAPKREYITQLRMIFIMYFTLELFQGVLQTLISSFSDDTVYFLALIISIFHVLSQNYDLESVKHEYMREEDVIPMNCLLLLSILLASRLDDSRIASGFIQFSILSFSLFPRIKLYIQNTGNNFLIYGFTLFITITTCFALEFFYIILYLSGILCLTVLLPLLYIYFQSFKRDITGSWDPDSIKKMKKLKKTSW